MLKTRIVTALCLLVVFMLALFLADSVLFAWAMLAPLAAAAWEWARLNHGGLLARMPHLDLCYTTVFVVLCIGWDASGWLAAMLGDVVWWGALALWVALSVLTLTGGQRAWQRLPVWLRLVVGWLILTSAWLAVLLMRAQSPYYLLSVMMSVWMTDVSAYFGGRVLGGRFISHKMAPAISPNKTWEGAIAGFIGVLIFSILSWQVGAYWDIPPSFFARVLEQGGWLLALPTLLLLVVLAILGDLQESMMKRVAGAKDSSRLLPGHGGVLDRVDALLPVLPLAMVLL